MDVQQHSAEVPVRAVHAHPTIDEPDAVVERSGEAPDVLRRGGRVYAQISADRPAACGGRCGRVGRVDQDYLVGSIDLLSEDVGAAGQDPTVRALDKIDFVAADAELWSHPAT